MAFRPLHDRVVVKRLEGEEKTKGGIIIPDSLPSYNCSRNYHFRRTGRGRATNPASLSPS